MKYNITTADPLTSKSDCLVVGVYERRQLSETGKRLDAACGGTIRTLLGSGDMDGSTGQIAMIHGPDGVRANRVLLVGFGKEKQLEDGGYRRAVSAAVSALRGTGSQTVHACLSEVGPVARDTYWRTRQVVELFEAGAYRTGELKSRKPDKVALARVNLVVSGKSQASRARTALTHGEAIAAGVALSKDLSNLPGNVCTPTYLASQARTLGRSHEKIRVSVLDEKQMEKLGMGSLLSVSRGSREPAKLIVMHYSGAAKSKKPVVLVGKGLTFDAGGISIKPAAAMDEMKYDMCGGASVLGAISACARMELPLNVVGVVPASENLPDGQANKPGDIVTSMAGKTIEILNTDAEGRLILCDALTYVEKFKPDVVIDIATLTGACVIALGDQASGLCSHDDGLVDDLLEAGQYTGDRAWRLPVWDEYQKQLDSNFADMANIGGRGAGTITAACFLSRFTEDYRWAHLDIAGTAWRGGKDKGATGRPVPLLVQYLLNRC